MKTTRSLSTLSWHLAGFNPYNWRHFDVQDIRLAQAEFPAIPAQVPGSVQAALLRVGVIPDWNQGMNSLACEWVENRHWIFQADLPDDWFPAQGQARLNCLGLDDRGWVYLNGSQVGTFCGGFTPHVFDLTSYLKPASNRLQIIFDLPPRWLGQIGYTSQMTEWKARFNYSWDWVVRLVQVGIWDDLLLEVSDGKALEQVKVTALVDAPVAAGVVQVVGSASGPDDMQVHLSLSGPLGFSRQQSLSLEAFNQAGFTWQSLPVQYWYPNGLGDQPLYSFTCQLLDNSGRLHDSTSCTLGFKHTAWLQCQAAPAGADPWVCAVNGESFFLQGFNWTPIRPNFADVPDAAYRKLLMTYRDLGCNILRVWGGAFLEKRIFYELCDQLGILVWQEFPLSSSGLDNWPPEDLASINALEAIARSYVARVQHHVSLLMWSGGNELQGSLDGQKAGIGKPVDLDHPLIARLAGVIAEEDPARRFVASSPSGPRFSASLAEVGLGLHWDVHGPWRLTGSLDEWRSYWLQMDALFHSEFGAPGASPVDLIEKYSGGLPLMPASEENPLWHRSLWWVEWQDFLEGVGREPLGIEEFVAWSQARQAQALEFVVRTLKDKFPRCGGAIVWMGHDSFPCTANTSIIDFDGNLKPAAVALRAVFLQK